MSIQRVVAAVLFGAGSLSCLGNDPPAVPSWDQHVFPILRGACSHCHGSLAGPGVLPTSRYDICSSAPFNNYFSAEKLWILGVDAMGNPVVGGASVAAGAISGQTGPGAPDAIRMPPSPDGPLYEYEATILDRWATVSQASCAKQLPNRKPTVAILRAPTLEMGRVSLTIQVSDPDGDQVFGYVKLGAAALQVIPGAGRRTYLFEGVQPTDALTIKLHDGYDPGP